jgi:hypothetical protein
VIGISRSAARARLRLAHVALDQPAVGAAHRAIGSPVAKCDDLVDVQARVRRAPAQDRRLHASFSELHGWQDCRMAEQDPRLYFLQYFLPSCNSAIRNSCDASVHSDCRCRRKARYGRTPLAPSHGYWLARRLALAFVALEEARHEELLGQRRQLHAAGLRRSSTTWSDRRKSTTSITARGCGA